MLRWPSGKAPILFSLIKLCDQPNIDTQSIYSKASYVPTANPGPGKGNALKLCLYNEDTEKQNPHVSRSSVNDIGLWRGVDNKQGNDSDGRKLVVLSVGLSLGIEDT